MGKKNYKKTILIDLDGVLNMYDGQYNENNIPQIKDGALEFLQEISKEYEIKIFSSRNPEIAAKWITENKLSEYIANITNIKEPCFLLIDDRCINFNGDYVDLIQSIKNFKVWYKK